MIPARKHGVNGNRGYSNDILITLREIKTILALTGKSLPNLKTVELFWCSVQKRLRSAARLANTHIQV